MRAVIFEKQGLDNLKIKDNVRNPEILDYNVLIKVITAGVNPIDYYVISGYRTIQQQQKEKDQQLKQKAPPLSELPVNPLPHVPGADCAGVVEKIGSQVRCRRKSEAVRSCWKLNTRSGVVLDSHGRPS